MTSPNTIIADMQAQIDAAKAEIERVTEQKNRMWFELAAEQAKNVWQRDACVQAREYVWWTSSILSETPRSYYAAIGAIGEALSTPSDTSALEAIVKKAGEVMREKCVARFAYFTDSVSRKLLQNSINELHAVTLEDITKRSANHE